jgi:acetyl-CoA acetyltransferase
MLARLPSSVAGTTINRFCSSGLQAIAVASHQIISEGVEAAIGGGVESISMTPAAGNPHPELQKRLPGLYMGMGDTAEIVAKRYKVSREVQDDC